MELCERGDLHSLLRARDGRLLSEPEVWRYYGEALRGLQHLHSLKILHRDIKSKNLFLSSRGVKVGDLGVARALGASTEFASTMVGTPYYLSPELCNGEDYNDRADVWALGVVLYELLTAGNLPFTANNQAALILAILRGSYERPAGCYSRAQGARSAAARRRLTLASPPTFLPACPPVGCTRAPAHLRTAPQAVARAGMGAARPRGGGPRAGAGAASCLRRHRDARLRVGGT
eukprot:scaffold217639_cov18-Tisochrysis_lutea.AAC.1